MACARERGARYNGSFSASPFGGEALYDEACEASCAIAIPATVHTPLIFGTSNNPLTSLWITITAGMTPSGMERNECSCMIIHSDEEANITR